MRIFLSSILIAGLTVSAPLAFADSTPLDLTASSISHQASAPRQVSLSVGRSSPIMIGTAFNKVAVANDAVIDVTPMSDTQLLLRGKDVGRTNIILYKDGRLVDMMEVQVAQDLDSIQGDLKALFPQHNFKLRRVASRIYVEGLVNDTQIAGRVIDVVESYAPDNVINALTVESPRQVALKVRFLEAGRDSVKQLGIGNVIGRPGDFIFSTGAGLVSGEAPVSAGTLFGGSGSVSIDVMLQALEEKGVIRTLAEPNLVATSGSSASFLAGGEFPIPVAADEKRIAIEFREFGVSLDFSPEVISKDRVALHVQPEVSQVDSRNAIRASGFEIPALIVRKADTTIELRDGQTFAIAGLLQNSYDNDVLQTPFLGDIPVLGSLFRSTRFRENETELIILVTPVLMNASEQPDTPVALASDVEKPSQIDLFVRGRINAGQAEG